MRNPFKRAARLEIARPTLRERLAATKAKAKQVLAVNAVILKSPPAPAPSTDRAALVNYATFLAFERDRVCAELYPHMGGKASRFVLTANAAERFFYPDGIGNGLSKAWRNVPPASSRAVKVLDLVGVDWRSNAGEDGLSHVDLPSDQDTGERPAVPSRWPMVDSALLDALDDLHRLDAAQLAMGRAGRAGERDADTVPGYEGLEDARRGALDRLEKIPADSLLGLQAKARAVLMPSVTDCCDDADIAASLARDLLSATNRTITPRPDPILVAVAETRRLCAAWTAALKLPQPAKSIDPHSEVEVAANAFHAHVGDVLLKTVPTTAAGCAALARYAVEFSKTEGFALDEDDAGDQNVRTLDLIARSPLL